MKAVEGILLSQGSSEGDETQVPRKGAQEKRWGSRSQASQWLWKAGGVAMMMLVVKERLRNCIFMNLGKGDRQVIQQIQKAGGVL